MATYIQGIQTSVGVVKYDYNYLANLPESDMTLSKQGAFACCWKKTYSVGS